MEGTPLVTIQPPSFGLNECLILTLLLPPRKSSIAVSSLDFDMASFVLVPQLKGDKSFLSILPALQLLICYSPFPLTRLLIWTAISTHPIYYHCSASCISRAQNRDVCAVKQSCGWKQVYLMSSLPLLTVCLCLLSWFCIRMQYTSNITSFYFVVLYLQKNLVS